MCDYNKESRKAANTLPVPLRRAHEVIGKKAHSVLVKMVETGKARSGVDLCSGRKLPQTELSQGHYMTPANYNRFLATLDNNPAKCAWCGGQLPAGKVQQHHVQNHREIEHHFHGECRQAQLLAIACTFGHLQPTQLTGKPVPVRHRHQHRRQRHQETVTVTKTQKIRFSRSW